MEKIKWHFTSKKDRITQGVGLFCGVMTLIWSIGEQLYVLTPIILIGTFVIGMLVFISPRRTVKTTLQRIKETTGEDQLELVTSFTDESIKIHYVKSGNDSQLGYDSITRFVDTKDLYILFSKGQQFVLVNKDTLTRENENDDFVRFIKEKCKNVK